MCYTHVPNPHKECNHYLMETCTNKKLKLESLKWKENQSLEKVMDHQV